MTNKLLTIAIPTYNRQEDLALCLKSIYSIDEKLLSLIEICVSDNNSEYDVAKVIAPYMKQSNFVFTQNDTNIGFDRNIQKLVLLGKSDYIMFLGDDDCVLEDGINNLIQIISEQKPDAILSNYSISLLNESKIFNAYNILNSKKDLQFEWALSNLRERISFISSITINRRLALSIGETLPIFYETTFIHVAILFAMLSDSKRLSYCAIPTVLATDKNPDTYDVKKTFIYSLGSIIKFFEHLYEKSSVNKFRAGILRHVFLSGALINYRDLKEFDYVRIGSLALIAMSHLRIVQIRRLLARA